MKRVVYVISNIDRWIAFEWIADSLRQNYDLSFVLLNSENSYFEAFLQRRKISTTRFNYSSKKDLPKTIFLLVQYLRKVKPEVVHTHFLDANLAGLAAGWLTQVPQRIYTRHHSVFHLRYHKKGRMYDWVSNLLATRIVAISKNVENILIRRERVKPSKIALIHHGFDLSVYQNIKPDEIDALRSVYHLPQGSFIIGVVSRYIDWKGVKYIIDGFKQFRETNPEGFLLLMNARGPNKAEVQKQLNRLPSDSYMEVPFEKDMNVAYQLFDCFVHAPIDEEVEAFGQVYIEAMAGGIPSILTLSGIASDYVKHMSNAMVIPYCNSSALTGAMRTLRGDMTFASHIVKQARQDVEQMFNFQEMEQKLLELYEH